MVLKKVQNENYYDEMVYQNIIIFQPLVRYCNLKLAPTNRDTLVEKPLSPIVPYKLYVVALMTLFNAVDTDGVSICRVTRVAPETRGQCYYKHPNITQRNVKNNIINLPVEVMHGVTRVTGDFIQTLPSTHGLLNGVLIIQNFVICHKTRRITPLAKAFKHRRVFTNDESVKVYF